MLGIEIFLPVVVHMLLVIALFFLLASRKMKAVKAKQVNPKETALDNKAWTDDVIKVSNNIANQFETPLLFYVLCTVTFLVGLVDTVSLVFAWSYVVLRYVHCFVHIGSNTVPLRMKIFALSLLIILLMLLRIMITLIAG